MTYNVLSGTLSLYTTTTNLFIKEKENCDPFSEDCKNCTSRSSGKGQGQRSKRSVCVSNL